ncbi:SUEL-type lectin domain-containing protein [Meloidogyne graminicola]|uniref:SUEL-type lectin domain-containing protein n=1 Tax=Meloidogyne graminicola TaxID=189291 RepID=A0A8T0A1Z5_9BILA|nr:SUEL-type lectin domain-containing protein [Meloidogyne graminicola]
MYSYLFNFSFFFFVFKFILLIILFVSCQQQQQIVQEPNIRSELVEALLTDSLRLRLVQACQGDRVNLQCPKNTYISPNNAFFGRLVPSSELCPFNKNNENFLGKEDTSCDFVETHYTRVNLCT